MSMATVMSQMPDVWRRVLAEHVPDQYRHCRACCSPTGIQASWPCQTFKVADEARALAEGYLPVPGAPAPRRPDGWTVPAVPVQVPSREQAWDIADWPVEPRHEEGHDHAGYHDGWSYGWSPGAPFGSDGRWGR